MTVNVTYGANGIGLDGYLKITDDNNVVVLTTPLNDVYFDRNIDDGSWIIEYNPKLAVWLMDDEGVYIGETNRGEHVTIRPFGYRSPMRLPDYGNDFDEMVLKV